MEYRFEEVSTPFNRTLIIDAGFLAAKRHVIYGILEADVTIAKERIKAKNFSFTSYIVACLGRAIAKDPAVQAYRKGGNKLVLFQDVDVVVMVEGPEEGSTAIPHIVRRANTKSVSEISDEIRKIQANPNASDQKYDKKKTKLFAKLPRFLRMAIYKQMRRKPESLRQTQGTVIVTSIGMFAGKGRGFWGITFLPMHTLGITLGGIQRKPAVRVGDDGTEAIAIGDFLNITLAFDHDVVDGAPAARFASRFVDIVEGAKLLEEEN